MRKEPDGLSACLLIFLSLLLFEVCELTVYHRFAVSSDLFSTLKVLHQLLRSRGAETETVNQLCLLQGDAPTLK